MITDIPYRSDISKYQYAKSSTSLASFKVPYIEKSHKSRDPQDSKGVQLYCNLHSPTRRHRHTCRYGEVMVS